MASLEDIDRLLVNRAGQSHYVEAQNLMAELQDTDLMLVNRGSKSYKVTGAEVKDSLNNELLPDVDAITIEPPVSGSGTELDPYILSTIVVRPAGSRDFSVETITIAGKEGQIGIWKTDNQRFEQPPVLIDENDTWVGNLIYSDSPESTADNTYTGNLQIGTVYFRWSVNQEVSSPTFIADLTLTEVSLGGDRFTDQSFVAESDVIDGSPIATKTYDAHVDGTFSIKKQFNEPLESSSGLELTFAPGTDVSSLEAGDEVNQTSNFTEPLESSSTSFFTYNSVVEGTGWNGAPPTGDNAQHGFDGNLTSNSWINNIMRDASNTFQTITIPGPRITSKYLLISYTSDTDIHSLKINGVSFGIPKSPNNSAVHTLQIDVSSLIGQTVSTLALGVATGMPNPGGFSSVLFMFGMSFNNISATVFENTLIFPPESGNQTNLIFPTNTDMTVLEEGDVVSQDGSANGTVSSITDTTVTLVNDTGPWTDGIDVTRGDKTSTGTVAGLVGTSVTLAAGSDNSWFNDINVVGPAKTVIVNNARLYCVFDSNGNVTNLINDPQDPPYTTQESDPSLTLKFPSTFPSGLTPDQELLAGTTLTVELTSENSSSSDSKSATVQPGIVNLQNVVGPDKTPIRSMTTEEFAEAQARFITYKNRTMIKCGEDAQAQRGTVIAQAQELGIDTTEVYSDYTE